MSIAGIAASSLFSNPASHLAHLMFRNGSTIANQFESDLQSGNLPGAQSAFAALEQKLATQSSNPLSDPTVSAKMTQVGQDLKAGNLPAAQVDYSNIQQTIARFGHLHSHGVSSGGSDPLNSTNEYPGLSTANLWSDPSLAVLRAYSSLQSPVNSALATEAGSLSINV